MIKIIYLLTLLIILLVPTSTNAEESPTLIDPINNHTVSDLSPKLSWNYTGTCPKEGNCFLVEVSKLDNFSTTEKSTYTNNTTYSPSLSEGDWFWHIKAKDENSKWTNFSQVYKFTINSKPNPTPHPSNTPTAPQSPSPTIVPISNSDTKGTTNEKVFTIFPDKTTLNSNESTTIQITIKNFTPNSIFYLKPSFFLENSTNYFGLTHINGNWIKNSITATSQYKITTDITGNWNGNIALKIDQNDSGFKGSGNYNLKVGRYTETGSGLAWSEPQIIYINKIEETVTEEIKTRLDTPSPTKIPVVLSEYTDKDSNEYEEVQEAIVSAKITHQIASLSAQSKEIPQIETKVAGDKQINWWLISSGMTLLLVSGAFVVYQRKKMYHA